MALAILAKPIVAQSVPTASETTTAGASVMTSSTLKLARTYTGSDFLSDFGMPPSHETLVKLNRTDFFTGADPTSGYVK